MSKGTGLHGGLLYVTCFSQIFQIFILLICILIIQITSFYYNQLKPTNIKILTQKQHNVVLF